MIISYPWSFITPMSFPGGVMQLPANTAMFSGLAAHGNDVSDPGGSCRAAWRAARRVPWMRGWTQARYSSSIRSRIQCFPQIISLKSQEATFALLSVFFVDYFFKINTACFWLVVGESRGVSLSVAGSETLLIPRPPFTKLNCQNIALYCANHSTCIRLSPQIPVYYLKKKPR